MNTAIPHHFSIYLDTYKDKPEEIQNLAFNLMDKGYGVIFLTSDPEWAKKFCLENKIPYTAITPYKPYFTYQYVSHGSRAIRVENDVPWSDEIKNKILQVIKDKKGNATICFDMDGTILDHNGHPVGKPIKENIEFLQELKNEYPNFKIVIFTARLRKGGVDKEWLSDYLTKNNVPFDNITVYLNEIGSGCDAIVDDRVVGGDQIKNFFDDSNIELKIKRANKRFRIRKIKG